MNHLTIRVAWHDRRWDGNVCDAPSRNAFCVTLKRIRAQRNEDLQAALAGRAWGAIDPKDLPPCVAESAGFMNGAPWKRLFVHPYADNKSTADTHGNLEPTLVDVPPYTTFAVPFAWMLRGEQQALDESLPVPLPDDEEPPFDTPWVFGPERQEALSELFFGRLTEGKSLALLYTKEGQPVDDSISRLLVAVGRVTRVFPLQWYRSRSARTYPFWDRRIQHSIRPDGADGFVLPYHDYLTPTGDEDEDRRRSELSREIAVVVEPEDVRTFSYAAELATPDVALTMLTRCLESIRRIRTHGIASGPWPEREDWLNAQIAASWQDRGAFPGLGSALEATGLRLGTSMVMELTTAGRLRPDADPWPVIDAIVRDVEPPPSPAYAGDLNAVRATWVAFTDERRDLLRLLSRFALTPDQATSWFDAAQRKTTTLGFVSDREILENPYRIAEADLGTIDKPPVRIQTIDRALRAPDTIAARFPVTGPARLDSDLDPRRVRAALVQILRHASEEGDALLSVEESIRRLAELNLARRVTAGTDWIRGNAPMLAGAVELIEVVTRDDTLPVPCLQLTELRYQEERVGRVLAARAAKVLTPLEADWHMLLLDAIRKGNATADPDNPRHAAALAEQTEALKTITGRKLAVLVGRAGTGKTTILGALTTHPKLRKEGILLLAPTGKARVRLGRLAGDESARTVAQFLHSQKRYDAARQRPLFEGDAKYRQEKNVVIDECSMLTLDDLMAILAALDLNHVERLILVGDPNQLPPIGVGRPFADLVGHLENSEGEIAHALARLTVEVRTVAGGPSDALRLAACFTREPQPVDGDRILSEVEAGSDFADLDIAFWTTPAELRDRLLSLFQRHLAVAGPHDTPSFDRALGLDERGWVPQDSPGNSEFFQILSPVRGHPHGVRDLNRWIQQTFRGQALESGRSYRRAVGEEEIVGGDKVIQIRNQRRDAWCKSEGKMKFYLANGEVGLVAQHRGDWFNVAFAGRGPWRFGYEKRSFTEDGGPLELAYALTIHKAQGSEFQKIFVVLPRASALLSRELLYTALTRARSHLVLLVEGESPAFLHELAQRSETARRNTNLFRGAVRAGTDPVPFADHLIHRTDRGELVRSKSELVIANKLNSMGVDYQYERVVSGSVDPDRLRPDFSFVDPAGELILWEHLGMLWREDYRRGWEWKRAWYERNGFQLGKNLFTSQDDERGGLDSQVVGSVAEKIRQLL